MSSGAAPAWQVREMEQHQLLESIVQSTLRAESGQVRGWMFQVVAFLSGYLYVQESGLESLVVNFDPQGDLIAESLVIAPIREFSRTKEEADYLVFSAAEKLMQSAGYLILTRIQGQSIMWPWRLYNAPTGNTEVPLPADPERP
jgi:hypothetical protein